MNNNRDDSFLEAGYVYYQFEGDLFRRKEQTPVLAVDDIWLNGRWHSLESSGERTKAAFYGRPLDEAEARAYILSAP